MLSNYLTISIFHSTKYANYAFMNIKSGNIQGIRINSKIVRLHFLKVETHYSYETSFLTQKSYFDVIDNDNSCKFDAIFKHLFSYVFYCFLFLIISIVSFLIYYCVLEYIKLL